jgi:hypothetical protein
MKRTISWELTPCSLVEFTDVLEEVSKFFFQVCYLMTSVLREYCVNDITINDNGEIDGM